MYINKTTKEEIKGFEKKVIEKLLQRGLIIEVKDKKENVKKEEKQFISTKEEKSVKTTKKSTK